MKGSRLLLGTLLAAALAATPGAPRAQGLTRTEAALDHLTLQVRLVRTAQGGAWSDRDVEARACFEPVDSTSTHLPPECIDIVPLLTANQKNTAQNVALTAFKIVYQNRGNLPTPTPDPSPTPTPAPTATPTP